MNRRGFFARCLAGAVLGLARNLPLPAAPKPVLDDPPMTATEVYYRQQERLTMLQAYRAQGGAQRINEEFDRLFAANLLLEDLPWSDAGNEPHTFKIHTPLPELFPRDR